VGDMNKVELTEMVRRTEKVVQKNKTENGNPKIYIIIVDQEDPFISGHLRLQQHSLA